MRIIFAYRTDKFRGKLCRNLPSCYAEELRKQGHEVLEVGEGHDITGLETVNYTDYDLYIEMENGRNSKGDLNFAHHTNHYAGIKTAVILIDSHGHPDWHEIVAKSYDHVFYAVWFRRHLFKDHPSAHFLPNSTTLKWFGYTNFEDVRPVSDFGFFGSKGGLDRADKMVDLCIKNGWTCDVRQVDIPARRMWPATGAAMSGCRNLFNMQQKHDLNIRIFESMATMRPLIHSYDESSGIDKLFKPWVHYVPYEAYTQNGLEEAMEFVMKNPKLSEQIAGNAYVELCSNHLVFHRVNQLMEVLS